MEKKTLAEILAEPATVEAIIKKAMEINELLLKVENMPEVEYDPKDYELIGKSKGCAGCCFLVKDSNSLGKCLTENDDRFIGCVHGGIFKRK